MKKLLVFMILFLFVISCNSGSSGGGGDTTNPVGVWTGLTGDNRYSKTYVLDNGEIYAAYTPSGKTTLTSFSGAIVGRGSSSNGTFKSSSAMDYSFENQELSPGSILAGFTPESILNAEFKYKNGNKSFISLNYDQQSSLDTDKTKAIGVYKGIAASNNGYEETYIRIFDDMTIKAVGVTSGCEATGTLAPILKGNLFRISFKFNNSNCFSSSTVFKGVLSIETDGDIVIIAPDPGYSVGVFFAGHIQS